MRKRTTRRYFPPNLPTTAEVGSVGPAVATPDSTSQTAEQRLDEAALPAAIELAQHPRHGRLFVTERLEVRRLLNGLRVAVRDEITRLHGEFDALRGVVAPAHEGLRELPRKVVRRHSARGHLDECLAQRSEVPDLLAAGLAGLTEQPVLLVGVSELPAQSAGNLQLAGDIARQPTHRGQLIVERLLQLDDPCYQHRLRRSLSGHVHLHVKGFVVDYIVLILV